MGRRIGDLAREAGISVETVRFYEREGLIDQPSKPARGWRNYNDVVQIQLGLVRLGLAVGRYQTAEISRRSARTGILCRGKEDGHDEPCCRRGRNQRATKKARGAAELAQPMSAST